MKGLVVDDSLVMRRVMKLAMNEAGINLVDEAKDGSEAITALESVEYDMVLMDWEMPNISGIDAVKTIRESGNQVPIIMVTVLAHRENVMEALTNRVNNYVVKPFNRTVLVAKILKTLEKSRALKTGEE